MRTFLTGLILSLVASHVGAAESTAAPVNRLATKLEQALQAPDRPAEHRAVDSVRKPLETLKFFGLRDDMRVLDMLPGGGYYTRLLAPALAEKGALLLTMGTGHLESGLLKEKPYEKVQILAGEATLGKPEGQRYYQLKKFELPADAVDMVTSFRVYHLFDEATRAHVNREVHKVLKDGGIYAVIDHTRRHAQPESEQNVRRFDPVRAILEIEAAGFDFVAFSPMHYSEADSLELEVGDPKVTGRSDRWALKFIKR